MQAECHGVPIVSGELVREVEETIEIDVVSPQGWMCFFLGCFLCPGPNLLGLCMLERRRVPASHVSTMFL